MELLTTAGRALALWGTLCLLVALMLPPRLGAYLDDRPARYGIAASGFVAIVIGFVIATMGG